MARLLPLSLPVNAMATAPFEPGPDFIPLFCPNPHCRHHTNHGGWHWKKVGFWTRSSDAKRIQRYRCLACGRYFSEVTFSVSYWLRRRDILLIIARLSVTCASLRQIATLVGVSHTTVARHLARLGRHSMLFHRRRLWNHPLTEPIAFDGFESFEFSQFFPFHFHLAGGKKSWFLYHFTDSPLRRKGRMTPEQRVRREVLEATYGRPDPKAIEKDVAELLETSLASRHDDITLHSDEHPAYPRAIRRLLRVQPDTPAIDHRTIPSTAPRNVQNPLFAVNLADLLIRHTGANHKRETIAFSRRRQAAADRNAVFLVWRNYIKPRREKKPPATPAMAAGIEERPWSWKEVLRERLFPSKIALPPRWREYYRRVVKTAVYHRLTPHQCRYAF